MLKRDVTYEDFNGNTVTDTLYFNLTKPELIQLNDEFEGGLQEATTKAIRAENAGGLYASFRGLMLKAYGVKTDDGKRFLKTAELREEFEQSAAYAALFDEFMNNEETFQKFLAAIMPKDMQAQVQAATAPLPPSAA